MKNKAKSTDRASKLTWLPKKTFTLEFSVPWQTVKKTYDKVLKDLASKTTLKGFRKGKAPTRLVEKSIDKAKLYEEVIRSLLPETYEQAIKKHQLAPIIFPKIQIISVKEKEDWQFKAIACERPEVKLGDYKNLVRGELAKTKIWTPEKGKSTKKEEEKLPQEGKIKIVTRTLLENIKVEISDILIEKEVTRMLSRLLDQVNTLGMTIQQYLASKGLTQEQLRSDFKRQAEETLKLEFILQAIVQEQKIKADSREVEEMIKAVPDEKTRMTLNNPQEKAYISAVIAKRKAIDFLTSL